jgi:hypothetical protein
MTSGGSANSTSEFPGLDASSFDLEDLLNPDEQRRFRRLCIETSADELNQLDDVIELHLDHIRANAGAVTDVETAELVADAAHKILALSQELDPTERALVRGAVEYFILNDDASDDLDDPLGFDDDARVLNSVLDRIERPEFKVTLSH